MRELKFRIWNNAIKYFVQDLNGSPAVFDLLGLSEYLQTNSIVNVDHFRFLQYTGLTDMNGVQIYEGDIVNYKTWVGRHGGVNETCRSIVKFQNGTFYPRFIDDINEEDPWYSYRVYDLKVIGNEMEHLHLNSNE